MRTHTTETGHCGTRSRYDGRMNTTASSNDELRRLASDAMRAHGLLPDFSASALSQSNAAFASTDSSPEVRDLRALLWSSIDNDDSLDLDQIEVAQALE